MTKGLRLFYVGPDEQASRGEAVEIMASSHEEAKEKGLALHAKGLLSLGDDFLNVELYVTDGEKSITYVLELTPIDGPDWMERTGPPTDHPSLF